MSREKIVETTQGEDGLFYDVLACGHRLITRCASDFVSKYPTERICPLCPGRKLRDRRTRPRPGDE